MLIAVAQDMAVSGLLFGIVHPDMRHQLEVEFAFSAQKPPASLALAPEAAPQITRRAAQWRQVEPYDRSGALESLRHAYAIISVHDPRRFCKGLVMQCHEFIIRPALPFGEGHMRQLVEMHDRDVHFF